jgi:hypothetical protein
VRAVLPAAALLAALCLAACGKKGPPSPPGPPDEIIFPRGYPVAPKGPPPTVSPPAQWPFGITPSTEQLQQ